MKSIVVEEFGGPDVLRLSEQKEPAFLPQQVLIEVHGASVNYADIKARQGGYHLGKKPPFIPGIDVAGIVTATGAEVRHITVGDRVVAFPAAGSYSEKTIADEALTYVIPDTLNLQQAAAAPIAAGAALHMLLQVARLRAGESVLVHGAAGGVGSAALALAKLFGAAPVIASIGSPWKEAMVREAGADEVIDYRSQSYPREIDRLTGGRGVDISLNPIGGATLERDLNCLAAFGRLVVFGDLDAAPACFSPGGLYTANRSITGFSFGHWRKTDPYAVQKTMHSLIDLLTAGRLKLPSVTYLPLGEAAAAHRLLENRQTTGKIVLLPS